MCIYIHIIYIKVYDTNEYTILHAIIYNNTNIYILVNLVITMPTIYNYKNIISNFPPHIHTT